MTWSRPLVLAGGVLLAITMTSFMRIPLLPEIGAELRLTPTRIGLITSAFAAGRLAMDLPAGWISDRFPAQRVLALAAAIVAAATASIAAAHSLAVVLVATCVIGFGSALANTVGMVVFSRHTPAGARGRAMAHFTTIMVTGQTVGPALGGLLADVGSWRTAHVVGSGSCVVALVSSLFLGPGQRGSEGRIGPDAPRSPALAAARFGTGERLAVLGLGFATFFALGALPQTLMPMLADGELGLSASTVGVGLLAASLARLPGSWATGFVADRVSHRAGAVPTLLLMAASAALLALPASTVTWVAAIVLISLFSGANGVGATIIADRSPPDAVGRNLGGYRLAMDVGLLCGAAITAAVYDAAGRAVAVLVPAGVLVITAALAAWGIRGPRTRADRPRRRAPVAPD